MLAAQDTLSLDTALNDGVEGAGCVVTGDQDDGGWDKSTAILR